MEQSAIQLIEVEISRNDRIKQQSKFEDRLVKIRNCLQLYFQRNISICGRTLVAKIMRIKKIIHSLFIIDIDMSLLNRLRLKINRSIWGFKPAKVKHTVMIGYIIQILG